MKILGIVILSLIIGYLIWFSTIFIASRRLLAHAENFPKSFTIGDATQPHFLYVSLGDSTALGGGATKLEETYVWYVAQEMAKKGYFVRVENLGRSGDKIADVLNDQLPLVNYLKPDLITLSVGANNATHFTSLADFESSYRDVLEVLATTQAPRILVATTPNMRFVPALMGLTYWIGGRSQAQTEVLQKLATGLPIEIVDLHERAKLDPKVNRDFYSKDKFHPSVSGYNVWAQQFAEKL